MWAWNTMRLIIITLFALSTLTACDSPDIDARSLGISPIEAAAEIFTHAPAYIAPEDEQATLKVWAAVVNGTGKCSEIIGEDGHEKETCCDSKTCCTNDHTANKYACRRRLARIPYPG